MGYAMKVKLIAVFLFSIAFIQIKAQPNINSVGIGTGILNLRGNALGGVLLFERSISGSLIFTFTPGAYFWINKKDMNAHPFLQPAEGHIKEFAEYLIPVRFGLRYNFGSSPSHPFGAAELGFNFFEKEVHTPQINYSNGLVNSIDYDVTKGNYIYASIGFALGYTFGLNEYLNLDVAVVSHYGDNRQYVNLMTALKFDW